MARIEHIQDLATAKQMALLLEKENRRLHQRLVELTRALAEAKGESGSKQLELELMRLQEQQGRLLRQLYGPSSEKRPGHDDESKQPPPAQTGHGPRTQQNLEVQQQLFELPPGNGVCPLCGGVLTAWQNQFEESEEITVVERRFVLRRLKRQKYRCGCGGPVVTAPGPLKLQPGGRYSLEFAVEVALCKYLDHLPLERQVRIMSRQGLSVTSQTLWDQLWALSRPLVASYEAVRSELLGRSVLHADETPWPLLGSKKSKGSKRWYVWCMAAPDAVYYQLEPSRSAEAARKVVVGFTGTLLVDGYKAYEKLARGSPALQLAFCWVHVRRRFVEAEQHYPKEAAEVLDLIGQLYAIEREAAGSPDQARPEAEVLAARATLRAGRSRPVVEAIRAWALAQRALPQSGLRRAIDYMLGLWPGLLRFLDDPRLDLDNNRVERELRGPVIGRKNHYGSKSERGTEVAALFYTLIETAKLRDADPRTYLIEAATAGLEQPGTIILPGVQPEALTAMSA